MKNIRQNHQLKAANKKANVLFEDRNIESRSLEGIASSTLVWADPIDVWDTIAIFRYEVISHRTGQAHSQWVNMEKLLAVGTVSQWNRLPHKVLFFSRALQKVWRLIY